MLFSSNIINVNSFLFLCFQMENHLWNQENLSNEGAMGKLKRSVSEKLFKWDLNCSKTSNLEYFFYLQEELNWFTWTTVCSSLCFFFRRWIVFILRDYACLILFNMTIKHLIGHMRKLTHSRIKEAKVCFSYIKLSYFTTWVHMSPR